MAIKHAGRATTHEALQTFAETVKVKMAQPQSGQPEDQLRAPFENFMAGVAGVIGRRVVCTGEAGLPDRLGRPDYAANVDGVLGGYIELKPPGVGADVGKFKGRNREQWVRFQSIPNLLYSDANEWGLYRNGELVGRIVRLTGGDVVRDGKKAVGQTDADKLEGLLRDFLSWQPIVPTDRMGKIDLERLAALLAPLCLMLRYEVSDALRLPQSPLIELAEEWRKWLFPEASDDQFADGYAQTVTFALLLGRSEGAEPLTLDSAVAALYEQHSALSRALQVLTDPNIRGLMSASLDLLQRVIGVVPTVSLASPKNPWLYFYEDFLAAYDPKLRKDVGAYYTPVEVVRAQVRLIDDLLVNRLDKWLGFADPDVVTLDPAAGTGTYLLGVIEHALDGVEKKQGAGAVPAQATALAHNLYGFEILVGPYAVNELRTSRAFRDHGATLSRDGIHVYLTDTLESPHAEPPQLSLFLKPIADQRRRALEVKEKVPVIVCLGNPPYDRHEAAAKGNKARTGNWVRWGEDSTGRVAIFRDFLDPAVQAGHGVHVKNLYNLYVYFWRWAVWKVFEHSTVSGPGIVSYISASSYLDGDAFCGMREHMRRLCDEIWILDLGGEGRGTRKSENVFAIQTPVAIAVCLRVDTAQKEKPAAVHYARIEGSRAAKLSALEGIDEIASMGWEDCPGDWRAPFRPAGRGEYFGWPLLTDLMPWQHTGCEVKRTWPICHDQGTLRTRWQALLVAKDRTELFKETRDRKVRFTYACPGGGRQKAIADLARDAPAPPFSRYAYRSLDLQWLVADGRIGDYLRPDLWQAHGPSQVYVTSLFNHPLGRGPALSACCEIPDRHHFRGSYGGKDVLPLYRDADARYPNLVSGLLSLLAGNYGRDVTAEDFLAYLYGMLAQPAFTSRFAKELLTAA